MSYILMLLPKCRMMKDICLKKHPMTEFTVIPVIVKELYSI